MSNKVRWGIISTANINAIIDLRRNGEREQIEIEPEDPCRLELENLSDAIRGEGELLLGRDDALGQARTLQALHHSATGEETALSGGSL